MAGKIPNKFVLNRTGRLVAKGAVAGTTTEAVGSASAFEAVAPVENALGAFSTYGGMLDFLPLGAGAVAFGAKTLGHNSAHEKITAVQEKYTEPLTKVTNTAFVIGGALGVYGVAKGVTQELNSLKHMYADLTGVPFEKVSTFSLLTGSVPKMLEEPRKHLIMEYGVRAIIQAVGLAWMIRGLRKAEGISMLAFMVPQAASAGADMIMGSSLMPVYAGVKNAYNSGQPLPPDAYADFVMMGSHDLKIRGEVGRMVAARVGEQYAAARTEPGEVLRELNDGRFMVRVKDLIAAAEAEYAARVAAHKAAEAEAKAKHDAKAHHAEPAEGSMVSKIKGEKPQRQPIGQFTDKIASEPVAARAVT